MSKSDTEPRKATLADRLHLADMRAKRDKWLDTAAKLGPGTSQNLAMEMTENYEDRITRFLDQINARP